MRGGVILDFFFLKISFTGSVSIIILLRATIVSADMYEW